jgi:hypothetical protein
MADYVSEFFEGLGGKKSRKSHPIEYTPEDWNILKNMMMDNIKKAQQ